MPGAAVMQPSRKIMTLCLLLAGTGFLRAEDLPADETRHVLALRVDFQPDELETTSGDGSFESAFRFDSNWAIDPLPHDSLYFADQLSFLDHYLKRASGNRLGVTFEIWPPGENAAYRLPYPMWHYHYNDTPEKTDEQLSELFRESIALADADDRLLFMGDDGMPRFDHVIIFHAGVGQDFGEDATPHDIPSAWLGPQGDGSPGAHVTQVSDPAGGSWTIDSGLILPESENHPEFMQGMGGLLVLQFAHELGLPNLYDSENGRSVIGKWGLMDQGSANFRALLPSLPSAWSRQLLGWDDPLVLDVPQDSVWLRANQLESELPRTVRVPLSSTEYLLIENRLRLEPGAANHTWAQDRNGNFARLDSSYKVTFVDTLGLPGDSCGAFVRVGNLDFDQPGSGLLIWHVDETRTGSEQILANSVNDLDERRGVDLEEADGFQDIGQDYGFFSSRSSLTLGSAMDPWKKPNPDWNVANGVYAFNDVTYAWDTRPSSNSNDGLVTGVRLNAFTQPGDSMAFSYSLDFRPPGHGRQLLPEGELLSAAGQTLAAFSWTGDDTLAVLSLLRDNGSEHALLLAGNLQLHERADASTSLLPAPFQDNLSRLVSLEVSGEKILAAARADSLMLFKPLGDPPRFLLDRGRAFGQEITDILPTPDGEGLQALAGNFLFDLSASDLEDRNPMTGPIAPGLQQLVDVRDGSGYPGVQVYGEFARVYLSGTSLFASVDDIPVGARLYGWDEESVSTLEATTATAVLRDVDGATLYHGPVQIGRVDCPNVMLRPVQYGPDPGLELAFVDAAGSLRIFSQSGTELSRGETLDAGTLSLLTGSRIDEYSQDGLSHLQLAGNALHGFDSQVRDLASWPRLMENLGSGLAALPELGAVWAVSQDGRVTGWEAELADWVWSHERGNANGGMRAAGTGHEGAAPAPLVAENRAWVWPNPASEIAHFHFWLDDAATVELRIYDAAGDLRDTQSAEFDRKGEHEIVWNTLGQAPGPYFCLLKATPRHGASGWTKKINCAVIR
jgi:M6 family metalloprotease-like protein